MPWYQHFHDPEIDSERKKYDKPVPSRKFIANWLQENTALLTVEDLIAAWKLDNDEAATLEFRLRAMIRDGELVRNRKGELGLPQKMNLTLGEVRAMPDGTGSIQIDGKKASWFLSKEEMRKVFHRDKVLVRPKRQSKNKTWCQIVRVLESPLETIAGELHRNGSFYHVIPHNPRILHQILIKPEHVQGTPGDHVIVKITERPGRHYGPVGEIIKVLEKHSLKNTYLDAAIDEYGLSKEWPTEALHAAEKFPETISKEDLKSRKDLRKMAFVTIDGEDAKDFDDAVFAEKNKNGFRLLVAIADVSHYVLPSSPLDHEAFKRANSTYLPGRVIPMLPERLSNGLCSLNPNVDRLVMVCDMRINIKGKITSSHFYDAVIHSNARLTYNQVGSFLEDGQLQASEQVKTNLQDLHAVYHLFMQNRKARGAFEFESREVKFEWDNNGEISALVPVARNDAHKLIEECMLAANVEAATFIEKNELKGVFRNHPGPDGDSFTKLKTLFKSAGAKTNARKVSPKILGDLIQAIKGRPDSFLYEMSVLRSMGQAYYSAENIGHFGLAYDAYTHFTSPIRRYPDLLVHRAIKAKVNRQDWSLPAKKLDEIAEHCSSQERNSEDAERDVAQSLKCEYMQRHLGLEYQGIITSVTSFGFFVNLNDFQVDGLVHISSLGREYFRYKEKEQCLVGEKSRKTYQIGQSLKVRLAAVRPDEQKIDFEVIN